MESDKENKVTKSVLCTYNEAQARPGAFFDSLYHMVPNRNFAARAVLACTASQNHWKMRKEVVDYRTALDAGVTSTIGTGKYEQTFKNQSDEHTKPLNQTVNSTPA